MHQYSPKHGPVPRWLAGVFAASVVMACAPGCIGQPPVPVTRSDLALTLIEVERAIAAVSLAPAEVNAVNRDFDRASLAFFSGSYAEVIRQLCDLRLRLVKKAESPADRVAGSLKARVDPPVWTIGSGVKPTARVTHVFEAAVPAENLQLAFRIRDRGGDVKFERAFTVQAGPTTRVDQTLEIDSGSAAWTPGAFTLEAAPRGGTGVIIGRWIVSAKSLDAIRVENDARLDSLASDADAGLADAIANCRGRNGLLRDRPSEDNLAEYLADLPELVRSVDAEIVALKAGRNPYRRQAGDHWRTLRLAGATSSCRVFAPAAATGDTAVPLVIAFHGAGGDENMFMDAYGRGLIKVLADKYGFLLATPFTYPFVFNPALADELVVALARDYSIDRSRVYVVGHSLGSGAASRIARERPGLAAAACCIAGGDFGGARQSCAALVFGGAIDPIVSARSLRRGTDEAATAGLAVEYRELEDYGHTLLVDRVLPEAVEWLLQRRLTTEPARSRRAARRAARSEARAATTAPAKP